MTIEESKDILKNRGVSKLLYSFDPEDRSSECYVLEKRHSKWVIYYWERGQEIALKTFMSEDSAARVFVDKVIRLTGQGV